MPGLMSHHTTPDGQRIMVESDVLDIDRRIKEGDPSVGWVGDLGMWLEFDRVRNVFIVCRYNPVTGFDDDVAVWPPPLNAGLLIKLRDGDTHRAGNDPIARMLAAEDAADRAREQDFEDYLQEEAAPRLVHAMRQDGVDLPGSRKVSFP